jgi:iron(III) transport system ATP-binding protein
MVAIHLQQVTKQYPAAERGGGTLAVDALTLSIPSGDLFFLLGPSGCGKTTLLRMVAGFILPTAGQVLFDTQDMTRIPPYQRDTGMVFQSYALWPHMTVADNVAFGLDVRKVKNPDRAKRIDDALTLVQMAHLKDRKPSQLSGGQQQRVALARALAFQPKCLLLDEPLSNLDAKLRLEMRTEIRRIVKQTGITAIYVTHDQKEALSMADGIAVMRAGKIEQTGSATDLYKHPANRFVAEFIGESNFLPATVESVNSSTITLKTDVGPLFVAVGGHKATVKPGEKLLAAFRPESVSLTPLAGATVNHLPAKRLSTTYLGEIAEHVVELSNKQTAKVFELNPRPRPASETLDSLTLNIPADNIMLVAP